MGNFEEEVLFQIVFFKNLATGQVVFSKKKKKRSIHPVSSFLELIEFHRDGLSIELPQGVLREGHLIFLEYVVFFPEGKIQRDATAKVMKVMPCKEDIICARCKMIQYESSIWDRIFFSFENRRKDVSKLFQSLQGDDES